MLKPLHHGGPVDENANLVQRFIDSEGGTILGTFLHTFGALLFTAGIALYIYQAHLVKAARASNATPSLRFLPYAHGFNLAGIALNGAGGLMRLYQSDHPGVEQLGTSAWVQLLFVKHLFLIVGVGLAVFLTYRTHVLSLRDEAPALFLGETRRMTGFAWTSFATILLASVLGAVATTQLTPAAAGGQPLTADPDDHAAMGHATSFSYHNATGTITGTALAPGRETSEIPVAQPASQLWIELTWATAQAATLDLEVRDPAGQPVAGKKTNAAGRVTLDLPGPVAAGTWKASVVSAQAVNERFHLFSRLTTGLAPNGTVLEETYVVNPKAPGPTGARFVEINLQMQQGRTIQYTWDVIDSAERLDFNVHLHVGDRVEYPVRGSWNRYEGTYTHNSTEDGVSLMWENPGSGPVRVHYRIVGDFSVHSKVVR